MRIEQRFTVPAPRERTWAVLLDWERQATWMPDADEVRVLTDAREGVGVIVAVKTRVLDVPLFTERLEVMAWDPPHELKIAHRSFIRGTGTWTLIPDGEATTFRWVEDLSLPIPVLGQLALLVYRPFMRHVMRRAMSGLRSAVVGPAPD